MSTPVRFMYPKAFANTGTVPGGPKMNIMPEHTNGAPKCVRPYGIQASTSSATALCAEMILLRFAP